jgi:hypothetical protein
MVFANQYPLPKGIAENDDTKNDIATYFSEFGRNQPLALSLDADLHDRILNAAARQGFAAAEWNDAFRQLHTKYESQLYALPLLNIEVPAIVVGVFIILVSAANLYQFNQGIRRTILKASIDPKSDEQFWLANIQQSRFLAVSYQLLLGVPLATLAVSVPVWFRGPSPITSPLAIALAAVFACLLTSMAVMASFAMRAAIRPSNK